MSDDNDDRFVVRIRGLPWSASEAEILNFLTDVNIVNGEDGIHKTFTREGRPSGEAYIEVHSDLDLQNAVAKDHESMGRRYIEVFKSTSKEMEYVLGRNGVDTVEQDSDGIVRCRGLPYQCSKEEIAQFFSGLEIKPNGIHMLVSNGRCSGEAYIQFANQAIAELALKKHKQKIGHRYIELFKSTRAELRDWLDGPRGSRGNQRRGPYDRPVGSGKGLRGYDGGRLGGRSMGGYGSYRGGGSDYFDDDYDDYPRGGYGMGGGFGPWGRESRKSYNGRSLYRDDYGGDANSNYTIHMRGLPFRATSEDVCNFFSPVVPVHVNIEYGKDGRVSGEANVDFASYQDAQAAMTKDKAMMQHRYIELFLRCDDNEGNGGTRMGGFAIGRSALHRGAGYDMYDSYGLEGGNYKEF